MPDTSDVYRPRKPQNSQYYQCVEDHFEEFERIYDDRFPKKYGFLRPYVKQVIYRYLDCGILHNGFARVKCGECGHEYLLALSCYSYCTSFVFRATFVDKRLSMPDFLTFFFFNLKETFPGSSNKYCP